MGENLKRHRQIAAAPQRSSSQCWDVIADLIRESITRSEHVSAVDVEATLQAARGVGRQLVAGGHLDKDEHSITVIAADLDLRLSTVSGDRALTLDENLNFVSGAAKARQWMIYLPTPEPLAAAVQSAVADQDHLSSTEPPTEANVQRQSAESGLVSSEALAEWARRSQ